MPTCTCSLERQAEYEENHVCELKLPLQQGVAEMVHNSKQKIVLPNGDVGVKEDEQDEGDNAAGQVECAVR